MNELPVLIEDGAALETAFTNQRQAMLHNAPADYEHRKSQLDRLIAGLREHQDSLVDAMNADFGRRAHSESRLIDVMGPIMDARHARKHLKKWMKPSRRSPEMLFKGNSTQVRYQPKGVVGVIVPWNFPLYLGLSPMIAALSAGNRVMIKMSETTPRTASVLADFLRSLYPPEEVVVVGGEVELAQHFSSLPFDHLVYTGSTHVGRLVMQAAAKNLTPVTLELGGKSPAIVSESGSLAMAASRIAHGKSVNGGQICISPDYALVPQDSVDEFVDELGKAYAKMYPADADGSHDTDVVTQRHFQRLQELLSDAESKGAKLHYLNDKPRSEKHLPLVAVTHVSDDMRLMQEEIFGGILPIKGYRVLDDVVEYINRGERPLALYFFGDNQAEAEFILEHTHSGGVSINDWGWHAFNHDMPFGGTGASGMGHYHGKEGFLELSNARSVFQRRLWFPIHLFNPPYGGIHKMAFRLFIGKPSK
ncbi:coniferyl aldehyde dehydrogenase [gamma proteobacterium HTCC5015]|nr:coniferyl aldehyde dehydrogenase [gamma proteobacterium HTCC5015]